MKIKHIVPLVFLLFTSCAILHNPGFQYPSDIKEDCINARLESKEKIESKGTTLKNINRANVGKKIGEKRINGLWCWYDPKVNGYVGGYCTGTTIVVGCNPNNPSEVSYDVLLHEFGHYWLLGIGVSEHDQLYKYEFIYWHDASTLFTISQFDENGQLCIYDVIKE